MENESSNVTNIDTPIVKKLILFIGIMLFGSATYLHFSSKKLTIPHEKISIKEPEPEVLLIAGFYHFAAMNVPWRHIVIEQIMLAHNSGLINASSKVYVTGLGKMADDKNMTDMFADSKFVYQYKNTTPEQHEFPTLMKLENFCLHNNKSLVWYANSKGASHPIDDMMGWRGIMNHFVLEKWRMCSDLLFSTNYTTCGALLAFDSVYKPGWNTYYAGNMWWAKCSHVNRLTRVEKLDLKNRYMAELYVTSEPDVGHFNCYTINWPHWDLDKTKTSCTINQPFWRVRRK